MLTRSFIGRGLFSLAALLAVTKLQAGDVSWFVSGTFDDEGAVTGTFVYDADTGTIRGWNLATSGGDPVNFPDFTYTPQNSSFSSVGSTLIFQGPLFPAINPFSNGFRQLRIGPFTAPLSDAGGTTNTVPDVFGNIECYNCGPARALSANLSGTPLPDMTVSLTHVGNFNAPGQVTYTLTVTNSGLAATEGQTVTLQYPVPGFIVAPTPGVGWSCGFQGNVYTCTNSLNLNPGQSFSPITIQATFFPPPGQASFTTTATVSGGGEANLTNDTSNDTAAVLFADMAVSLTANGTFKQGEVGDTYTLLLRNAGAGFTSGSIVANVTLPSGVTPTALGGTGWNCTLGTLSCNRPDLLTPGSTYPPITVSVNIAANAPATLAASASVTAAFDTNPGNNTVSINTNLFFPPFNCTTGGGAVPTLRQEGGSELAGDFIVICSGGVPTPTGQPLPIVSFNLNTPNSVPFAARLLSGAVPNGRTESLALLDEPAAASQMVCADASLPCSIPATGSGQGDYTGASGRPNVFQAVAISPTTQRFNIPFDPPGLGTRILRFTNLRVDARQAPPGAVSLSVGATGSLFIPFSNPQQLIGFVAGSESITVQGGNTIPYRISQFMVTFTEGFASSLRPRSSAAFAGNDTSPAPANQNVPGQNYNAESGFHNSAFPVLSSQGDLSKAGVADSGTRLIVKVANVPSGVQLMVPGSVRSGTSTNPNLGTLRLVTTDLNGGGAFLVDGISGGLVPMSLDVNGNAYATYEVLSTDPQQIETVSIPVAPLYPANNAALLWSSTVVNAGLAPLDPTAGVSLTASIPRFAAPLNFAVAAAQPPVTIGSVSVPAGVPGAGYSFLFTASGGVGSYKWSAGGLPSFLSISTTGLLTGTIPASPLGSYSFSVSVTDAGGNSASAGVTLKINRPALTLNVSQIPSPPVGVHFSTILTSGGVPPITWSGSGLPSWLSLSPDGILQGTPPAGSNSLQASANRALLGKEKREAQSTTTYGFSVTATDATGNSGTSNVSVTVTPPPLVITTATMLTGAMEGLAYSTQLSASGGTPPYKWSGTGLPSGITLAATGVVSGTPASGSAGPNSFQATVQDADATTQTASFTIPVASAANKLTITSPSALPDAGAGLPYNQGLTATGGKPPYTWSETSVGQGIGLSSGGVVGGTAASPAMLGFTGQVTDSSGATAAKSFTLNVVPKFGITTPSPLASGIVGVAYFQLLGALGGVQPYQWSISGGLPPGLGFTPDGTISGVPTTAGTYSISVTVRDASTNIATAPFQITIQPPANVDLILSAGSLAFSGQAGGFAPPVQTVGVNATGNNSISFSASTDATWIRLASNSGPTPASLSVFVDQTGLGPGFYQGTVIVSSSIANSKSIPVSLTVTGATPSVSVSPASVQLFSVVNSPVLSTSAVLVTTASSTPVAFQVNVVDLPFLTASPMQGSASQSGPAVVNLSADTHALAPGFYRGRVEISSGGATAISFVTVQVGSAGKLILSSHGTTLDAQVGSSIAGPATQSFRVLGADATPLHFTVDLVGSAPFLTLVTTSGVASLSAPVDVQFRVSSTGLALGVYYGRIRITSPDASNSPQEFIVVVNVRPAGSSPDLNPFPSGLVFTAGSASQTVQAYTDSSASLPFQVAVSTRDGAGWLSASPSKTTISAGNPTQVLVSANAANLAGGIYHGFVALAPATAQVRTVAVTLIVPGKRSGAASSDSEKAAAGGCSASQLVLTQTGLSGNFNTAASWPRIVSAQLTDDCGSPISTGNVVASFSNGDPPLTLDPSDPQSGSYSTNWAPSSAANPVAVTLSASATGFAPVTTTVSGGVAPNVVPNVPSGGVLHLLYPKTGGLLAPGTIVEIFGTGLAAAVQTSPSPPPTSVNGTTVYVSGTAVPLYYVSPTQINAELPFELAPGREYQLLVAANNGYTTPLPIQAVTVAPGVASFSDGHVIAQHSDYSLVSSASPAKAGEPLVVYLAGMGATDTSVATGAAAPSGPLANVSTPAKVLVDGQQANIIFAGLTPQAVGLYQINFTVPAGVHAGDVTLEISQGSTAANKTLLPVAASQ